MTDDRATEQSHRGPVLPSDLHELKRLGEARTGGGAVYVWIEVLEELIYAALYRSDRLQTALLLGDVRRGPGGVFVEVRGYTELGSYDDHEGYIEELNQDWQLTHNRIQRAYPGMRVVGWVSARAGSRGVVGPDEQLVHRTFFNLPHQIAVVLDPDEQQLGVYGADREGYLINVGFNLVRTNEPEPTNEEEP